MKELLKKLRIKEVNAGACSDQDTWYEDPEGQELISYNPSTGEPIAKVIQATDKTYDQVIEQAIQAFKSCRVRLIFFSIFLRK